MNGQMLLAHGGVGHLAEGFATFGALWWWDLPLAVMIFGGIALLLRIGAPYPDSRAWARFIGRASNGAARIFGTQPWVALPLAIASGVVFPAAGMGFYWDVAWHVDIGRDEFLFSPPHIWLLVGVSGIAVVGFAAIASATVFRADTHWRFRGLRIPYGGAVLAWAGTMATIGYGFDELWHWAYGLDVSMWGPTHVTMISAATFTPLGVWLLVSEAGETVRRSRRFRTHALIWCGLNLVALSAFQLEFDLGVTQWQTLFQPILIMFASGFALVFARHMAGRGGAVAAVAIAASVRGLFWVILGVHELTQAHWPLYLASAVAVELLWEVKGSTLRRGLVLGSAVAVVGLASEWTWSHIFMPIAWQPRLLGSLWLPAAVAIASAVLGLGAARIISARPSGIRTPHVVACLGVLLLGLMLPLPRHTPDSVITIDTSPAGEGFVNVRTTLEDPDLGSNADRYEVFSWQGGSSLHSPLEQVSDGEFVAVRPVPVGGTWKSLVLVFNGDRLGAAAVFLPADELIGASELPVVPTRTVEWSDLQRALQREAHDGPVWPGVVAYTWVLGSFAFLMLLIIAGFVSLDRRRRSGFHGPDTPPTLKGRRVIVTGAAGAIGSGLVQALRGHGAQVVGFDLRGSDLDADITDPVIARSAVASAAERMGGVDCVVNNAGVGDAQSSALEPDEQSRRIMDVNLFGAWNITAAALAAGAGQVVNVTSGLAVAAVPYAAAYAASKNGLGAYSDSLRLETDVTVCTVLPGYIRTPIHDTAAGRNASLNGIARSEPVWHAVAAIVGVVETGRRSVASSPLTATELWIARHFPRLAERALRGRVRRAERLRGRPVFDADTMVGVGSGPRTF